MQMTSIRSEQQATTIAFRPTKALTLWLGANLLDALLSFYLLGIGGVEGNPMLARVQAEIGTVGMLTLKVALATVVAAGLIAIGRGKLLGTAGKLMSIVVIYNAILAASVVFQSGTPAFIA